MSRRTAQFVIVAIFAARIAAEMFSAIPEQAEIHFDGLLILVQGWMTQHAYSRNPDGTPVSGTGDGGTGGGK